MNKLKYYLLLLIFAFVGVSSFTSAGSYSFTGNVSMTSSVQVCGGRRFMFYLPIPLSSYNSSNSSYDISCEFTNLTGNYIYCDTYSSFKWFDYDGGNNEFITLNAITGQNSFSFTGTFNALNPIQGYVGFSLTDTVNRSTSFDYHCVISGNNVFNSDSLGLKDFYSELLSCQSNLSICQSDLATCQNSSSGGSCSNTGTVSDLTNKVLLYTGEVSLNNSSYKNIFNYGENGAGTYCIKLSSSSPQTLTFGFANGGTTTPSNLYTLYNDQYGEVVCLYGNKPYFNAKLNSSSNTVSYEIYKLSDLYSSNVCLENECPSCPSCPSCEDCSQYQEDLLSCQEDNESLENMNSSLNDQLESCLLNGGNGCDPETDSGCVVGSQLFNLFWSHNGNSFSLPITNNLFLLSGMKATSDSGVVILGTYDSPIVDYSMDSESSDRVINLVVGIFSILAGLLFVVVAGYYLKKFLNYVLFPYKK